jgi:hypothetical protein
MIEPAILKADATDWRSMLLPDRPTYVCPNCRETSMQFFVELPDDCGRREVFRCLACGTTCEL